MGKAIHISEVLRLMNQAITAHQTVSFKAWRLGKNASDPERGQARTYDHVLVKSHSKFGSYNVLDPLTHQMRHVHEAFIFEFLGRNVYW